MKLFALFLTCLLAVTVPARAQDASHTTVADTTTVRVMFTPGASAATAIIAALDHAHSQILVQAFSLTHRGIADALLRAYRRGIDVKLLVDAKQAASISYRQISYLARAGLPIWLDNKHASAHNKIILIDSNTATSIIVTGSFNFTHAAQYTNAENVLFLSNNPTLTHTYQENWQLHFAHASPYAFTLKGPTP